MTVSEPVPLVFVPADGPVREAVTKVGGQPVWLEEPQWPLSLQTGRPMEFLGQFALEGGRLAHLFMTGGQGEYVDGTWEPEGGENALVIQPGGHIPDFVTVERRAEGPSAGADHLPRHIDSGEHSGERSGEEEDRRPWQYLGGPGVEPHWLQGDETPGEGWQLVVQLDSGKLPFDVDSVTRASVMPSSRRTARKAASSGSAPEMVTSAFADSGPPALRLSVYAVWLRCVPPPSTDGGGRRGAVRP